MRNELAFIVEGHCEYDSFISIISKIKGSRYYPISNASGIYNIIKNTDSELLKVIKNFKPIKIIICLDGRDAVNSKVVKNCVELKELIKSKCDNFIRNQELNGSLLLPNEIVVVVADKTFDSWICADFEGLKNNELINASLITETYTNVDIQIPNPCKWLGSKLQNNIDLKSKSNRKKIVQTLRPHIAIENSRSFRKFCKELDIKS